MKTLMFSHHYAAARCLFVYRDPVLCRYVKVLSRYRLSNCITKITRACCALQSAAERTFSCSKLRRRSL